MADEPALTSSELYRKYRYGDPGRHNPGPPLVGRHDPEPPSVAGAPYHVTNLDRLLEPSLPIPIHKYDWYTARNSSFPNQEPLKSAALSYPKDEPFRGYRVAYDNSCSPEEKARNYNKENQACRCHDTRCRSKSGTPKRMSDEVRNLYKNDNYGRGGAKWRCTGVHLSDQSFNKSSAEYKARDFSKVLHCSLVKEHDTVCENCQKAEEHTPEGTRGYEEILKYEPKPPEVSRPVQRHRSAQAAWRVTRTSSNSMPRAICLRSQSREKNNVPAAARDSASRARPRSQSREVKIRHPWSQLWNPPSWSRRQARNVNCSCQLHSCSRHTNSRTSMREQNTPKEHRHRLCHCHSSSCICPRHRATGSNFHQHNAVCS